MLSPASDIDDVLDALDARGKSLSDFTADVSLTDVDNANGTDSTLSGKIWMQKLPGDDARLRVTFDKKITNGKEKADKSEYTLDKGWLIDRKYADRQEIRRQVLREFLPADLSTLIGPVTLKFMPKNPFDSIVICEEWSGFRKSQTPFVQKGA